MIAFAVVGISYSLVWLFGMYFMLHRLHRIRKRTEQRLHEYDEGYILPVFRKPWLLTSLLGISVYIVSIGLIILFLKP